MDQPTPTRKFRTIRGNEGRHAVDYYTTRERRDLRAQYFADRDRAVVLCEEWTEDAARSADPINEGWVTVAIKRPSELPTTEPPEGDEYVIVRGGVVQNNPRVPVLDMDVLDEDVEAADEVLTLRARAIELSVADVWLREVADECAVWLREHHIRFPGDDDA